MYIKLDGFTDETWEELSVREKFDIIREELEEYTDRGIDGACYYDGTGYEVEQIVICCNAMFADLVTVANFRWWEDHCEDYHLHVYGRLSRRLSIDVLDTDIMSLDDVKDVVDICDKLLDYPIIEEMLYSELEEEAFDYAFRDEFMEDGVLSPEWQDIGMDTMRELAWNNGHVEGDYFYINTDAVEHDVFMIRARRAV